jgi:hypothetical protein
MDLYSTIFLCVLVVSLVFAYYLLTVRDLETEEQLAELDHCERMHKAGYRKHVVRLHSYFEYSSGSGKSFRETTVWQHVDDKDAK